MNIAIIGAGFIAGVNARTILATGNNIHTVVSNITAQAEEFAANYNAKEWKTDYKAVDTNSIDCVHICTEPSLHYEMICYFAEKNIPIICEKPLTLKKDEAESIDRLIKDKEFPVCVCFNNRFYPAVKEMKRAVTGGRLGEPVMLYGSYEQSFHIPPVMNSWRFDADSGNDLRAVSEIGSHLADLIQFVTGEDIVKVSAKFKNRAERLYLNSNGELTEDESGKKFDLKNEDMAIVTAELSNGAIASMCLSEVSAGKVNELKLNVICKAGRAGWSNEQPDKLNTAIAGGESSSLSLGMQTGFSDSYIAMFQEFYNLISTGSVVSSEDNFFATVSDACKNVGVCRAILESAENDGIFTDIIP